MSNKLQVSVIQCFTTATVETFSQMVAMEIKPGKPHAKSTGDTVYGVTGVIGLTGDVRGVLAITLQEKTALKVIGSFTGDAYKEINADVVDGVKELANIITGAAKAKLDDRGYNYQLSLPKVVAGYNYVSSPGAGTKVVIIPFMCDYGEFMLDIALKA
ncbi:MAG: chemotaxis protein CheX [Planctomycetota bacterium]|jgi:chemotaxis protein CheX|nr:chemotaxis protein CheX [Planctomycetota bacterium]